MTGANNLTVTVKTDELLAILKKNRIEHNKQYHIAKLGYQAECVKQLRKKARLINSGKIQNMSKMVSFNIHVPQNYTYVYDQLIGMLEMAQEKEVELSGTNYNAWILDEWSWSTVKAINDSYTINGYCR